MAREPEAEPLNLTEKEKKTIKKSVDSISKIFQKRDRNIKSIIGLVSKSDVKATKKAVEVRFAEENVLNVQMNMVAFD
jgi:3-deoxy-D-arabino-heptulosonate 7-phosphate (DAHP) synthase